jgi:hypothetical protein
MDGRNSECHPSPSFIGVVHQRRAHLRSVQKCEPPLLLRPTPSNSLSPSQPVELIQAALSEQLEDSLAPGAAEAPCTSAQGGFAARQPAVRAGLNPGGRGSPGRTGACVFNQFHRRHSTRTLGTPSIADCPDLAFPTAGFAPSPPTKPCTSGSSTHRPTPRQIAPRSLSLRCFRKRLNAVSDSSNCNGTCRRGTGNAPFTTSIP